MSPSHFCWFDKIERAKKQRGCNYELNKTDKNMYLFYYLFMGPESRPENEFRELILDNCILSV